MIKPPEGYDSWIDYAIKTMDTRQLHLDSIANDNHWGFIVQRQEMEEAVREEFSKIKNCEENLYKILECFGDQEGVWFEGHWKEYGITDNEAINIQIGYIEWSIRKGLKHYIGEKT